MCQPHDQHPKFSLSIDWDHLQEISDSNTSFAFDLLTLLAQDTKAKINTLREMVHAGNLSEFQELTHYVKGAAANMGVTTIVAIAQQLEAQDPTYDNAAIELLLNKLESALYALEQLVQPKA